MGLANQGIAISNVVDLGNNGPSVELNNRPTLIVSRSTAESPTKRISLAGITAVNFQAGVNAILQTATMVGGVYVFVNTQPGVVTLALDNGNGTVGGQAIYTLAWGAPVKFFFDGTNLN